VAIGSATRRRGARPRFQLHTDTPAPVGDFLDGLRTMSSYPGPACLNLFVDAPRDTNPSPSARLSRRAAILTVAIIPPFHDHISQVMPMRTPCDDGQGDGIRACSSCWMATAHCTASTTLANSASRLSPTASTTLPRCCGMVMVITSR